MPDTQSITQLLQLLDRSDDANARQRLWTALYDEVRDLARRQMSREPPGHTLQPTALVHETFLRLFGGGPIAFENRRHFFGAIAQVMCQIRVDAARKRLRQKRGGGRTMANVDDSELPIEDDVAAQFDDEPDETLALHEAIERLARLDEQQAQVVKLRYFAGFTETQTAEALGLSRRSVQWSWKLARGWLQRELSKP